MVVERGANAWLIEAYRYTIKTPATTVPQNVLSRPGVSGRAWRRVGTTVPSVAAPTHNPPCVFRPPAPWSSRRCSSQAPVAHPRSSRRSTSSSAAARSTTAPARRAAAPTSGSAAIASPRSATSPARTATTIVDATGLAVAPGFINMLSWSTESLLADGRSQGEIRQGVTTQIFGEGSSMGPLNDGDEEARRRADGRHQVRHHVDDAVGVPDGAGAARRVAERGVVHRRDDHPRARDRARGQEADAGSSSTRCARWCARRWRRARSASARR